MRRAGQAWLTDVIGYEVWDRHRVFPAGFRLISGIPHRFAAVYSHKAAALQWRSSGPHWRLWRHRKRRNGPACSKAAHIPHPPEWRGNRPRSADPPSGHTGQRQRTVGTSTGFPRNSLQTALSSNIICLLSVRVVGRYSAKWGNDLGPQSQTVWVEEGFACHRRRFAQNANLNALCGKLVLNMGRRQHRAH